MDQKLNAYKQNQINTTSKEKLVLMLYDGEIKFLKKAIDAIEDNNIQEAHTNLVRSQDILVGLMSGLNMEAGQIAENLFNLYEYMHYKLMEANVAKDIKVIEEVLNMVSDLRDTWNKILIPQKAVNQ